MLSSYYADGELLRRYVYGAHYLDELVAKSESGSLTFYLQDSNYNVVALADEDAHVTERYWYEPYGEVTITDADGGTQETVLNDVLLFQGQRRDPETGLYYFRNRYYSPMLGRFAQRDPAEYKDGMSFYAFAIGSPVDIADPSGKWLETLWDVACTVYDAARFAKNTVETGYHGIRAGYHAVAGNEDKFQEAKTAALTNLGELGESTLDLVIDGLSTAAPGVPAGGGKLVRQALQHGDEVADAAKAVDKLTDAAKAGEKLEDAAKAGRKLFEDSAENFIKKSSKEPGAVKEGIYEFIGTDKKKYVGQSEDIARRLGEHIADKKLDPAATVKLKEVLGGKTAREIEEYKHLREITGNVHPTRSPEVSNKVWPVSEERGKELGIE